jgi:hypothetical protein
MSNGELATPADVINHHSWCASVLVDVVDGDIEVLYRRQNADWLRVVPLDEDDEDNIERCAGYEIKAEPIAQPSFVLFHSGAPSHVFGSSLGPAGEPQPFAPCRGK